MSQLTLTFLGSLVLIMCIIIFLVIIKINHVRKESTNLIKEIVLDVYEIKKNLKEIKSKEINIKNC